MSGGRRAGESRDGIRMRRFERPARVGAFDNLCKLFCAECVVRESYFVQHGGNGDVDRVAGREQMERIELDVYRNEIVISTAFV